VTFCKEALTARLVCLVTEENLSVVDVLLCELADPLPRVLGVQQLTVRGGPAGGAGDALTGGSLRICAYVVIQPPLLVFYVPDVYLMHFTYRI
jgi:hypothetical protein